MFVNYRKAINSNEIDQVVHDLRFTGYFFFVEYQIILLFDVLKIYKKSELCRNLIT